VGEVEVKRKVRVRMKEEEREWSEEGKSEEEKGDQPARLRRLEKKAAGEG
jgi:hypothetical protein